LIGLNGPIAATAEIVIAARERSRPALPVAPRHDGRARRHRAGRTRAASRWPLGRGGGRHHTFLDPFWGRILQVAPLPCAQMPPTTRHGSWWGDPRFDPSSHRPPATV